MSDQTNKLLAGARPMTGESEARPSESSLDILWGAEEIAAFIKRPVRPTFHLLEKGQLPARKVGKQWVASRSQLAAHFTATPIAEPTGASTTPNCDDAAPTPPDSERPRPTRRNPPRPQRRARR
jgi:hypothetical protein